MTRAPHVSRAPWRPPANPPREWRPWAEAIVGLVGCLLVGVAFVLLWVGR